MDNEYNALAEALSGVGGTVKMDKNALEGGWTAFSVFPSNNTDAFIFLEFLDEVRKKDNIDDGVSTIVVIVAAVSNVLCLFKHDMHLAVLRRSGVCGQNNF